MADGVSRNSLEILVPMCRRRKRSNVLYEILNRLASFFVVADDLNAAITLTLEGTKLQVEEWREVGRPNSWLATYYSNPRAMGIGVWADTPARAVCEAYLAYSTEVIDRQPAPSAAVDEDDEHVTFY